MGKKYQHKKQHTIIEPVFEAEEYVLINDDYSTINQTKHTDITCWDDTTANYPTNWDDTMENYPTEPMDMDASSKKLRSIFQNIRDSDIAITICLVVGFLASIIGLTLVALLFIIHFGA